MGFLTKNRENPFFNTSTTINNFKFWDTKIFKEPEVIRFNWWCLKFNLNFFFQNLIDKRVTCLESRFNLKKNNSFIKINVIGLLFWFDMLSYFVGDFFFQSTCKFSDDFPLSILKRKSLSVNLQYFVSHIIFFNLKNPSDFKS